MIDKVIEGTLKQVIFERLMVADNAYIREDAATATRVIWTNLDMVRVECHNKNARDLIDSLSKNHRETPDKQVLCEVLGKVWDVVRKESII